MLILTIVLGLETKATDFSNAFAQADMTGENVYISAPPFMKEFKQGTALKLNKSLYGQVDAPKRWYDKLRKGLEARGFKACKADPCLFISRKVICICYVDDCLWFARDIKNINRVLKSFEEDGDKYNWEMSDEGTVTEYLGINIKATGDGGYRLTQPGLTQKILEATGMTDCSPAQCSPRETSP